MITLPLCGYGVKGFGCGKAIERVDDLFRCADCKAPFHHYCLVAHFADGKPHEVDGHGKVTEHKMAHAFAFEIAYLVREVATLQKWKQDRLDKESDLADYEALS